MPRVRRWRWLCASAALLFAGAAPALAADDAAPAALFADGRFVVWNPETWLVAPFVLMLLAIAVIPLVREHWWEHNKNKLLVSLVLSVPMLAYLVFAQQLYSGILLTMLEFSSFLCLLLALFTVSGGIVIKGAFRGRPAVNTAILAVGAVLASFMGTTGAAMLLIRPLLNANAHRKHQVHTVVFFIFCVANCGGLLTPLGDPPLFLGFLKGVAFEWTLQLWKEWLLVNGALLAIYFLLDRYKMRGENPPPAPAGPPERFGLGGARNFLLLALVPATILVSARVHLWWHHEHLHHVESAAAAELLFGEEAHGERAAYLDPNHLDEYLAAVEAGGSAVEAGGFWTVEERQKVADATGIRARFAVFEAIALDHAGKLLRRDNQFIRAAAEGAAENPHRRYLARLERAAPGRFAHHEAAREWGTVTMEAVVMGFQVLCFVLIALVSLKVSRKEDRARNGFTWHPIQEVGYLFFGIFVTMIPALIVLNNSGGQFGALTMDAPYKFFWATGILSSFLDNAPTYLTFLATAQGALGVTVAEIQVGDAAVFLAAISCGAVFMGANTYIGNAPNFMVKSIAEERKIRMPSFFGYMLYSVLFLMPLFALVTYLFFPPGEAPAAP